MSKILIIDTFNFLHRAYHALPKTLTGPDGELTNAVYGVTSMVITVLDQVKPDYIVAAMDTKGPTFRSEDFEDYKAHRKPIEDELLEQVPKVVEVLEAFGIKPITAEGYEADDIIATLVDRYEDSHEIVVVSNDKDLWQLTDKNIIIMVPGRNNTVDWIGRREAEARFGFSPDKISDYKGLRGDPSDNIPGIKGIGDKTATKLLQQFEDLDDIYENIDQVEPPSLKEKIEDNKKVAILSRKLACLMEDVPMDFDLKESKFTDYNRVDVKKVLEKYRFKSLIKRLGFEPEPNKKTDEVHKNQLGLL